MRDYTQLTQAQRYQIYALKKAGLNQTKTAVIIGVDKGTVSRELKRNSGLRGYRPQQAHTLTLSRRANKATPRIDDNIWQRVIRFLCDEWSPEQISGWLRAETEHHQSRMDLPIRACGQGSGRYFVSTPALPTAT